MRKLQCGGKKIVLQIFIVLVPVGRPNRDQKPEKRACMKRSLVPVLFLNRDQKSLVPVGNKNRDQIAWKRGE